MMGRLNFWYKIWWYLLISSLFEDDNFKARIIVIFKYEHIYVEKRLTHVLEQIISIQNLGLKCLCSLIFALEK